MAVTFLVIIKGPIKTNVFYIVSILKTSDNYFPRVSHLCRNNWAASSGDRVTTGLFCLTFEDGVDEEK